MGILVSLLLVGLLAGLLVGCVIPPSLEVDNQDAGVNSPPAILAVRSAEAELSEPGPVVFTRGAGTLNAELIDTDLLDTLYVRIFVNYTITAPTPARSTCTAAPTGEARRSVTCDLTALCGMNETDLNMSIVVFDRQPLEAGTPTFQAMPEGGLKTSRFYFLKCSGGA